MNKYFIFLIILFLFFISSCAQSASKNHINEFHFVRYDEGFAADVALDYKLLSAASAKYIGKITVDTITGDIQYNCVNDKEKIFLEATLNSLKNNGFDFAVMYKKGYKVKRRKPNDEIVKNSDYTFWKTKVEFSDPDFWKILKDKGINAILYEYRFFDSELGKVYLKGKKEPATEELVAGTKLAIYDVIIDKEDGTWFKNYLRRRSPPTSYFVPDK